MFLISRGSYHWELSKLGWSHFHQLIEIAVVLESFLYRQEMEKSEFNFFRIFIGSNNWNFYKNKKT